MSQARAQTVANYLAISLNVPEARVHVEGHGSDEPVNAGKDAASLAANRRVEIVIEGARFEANAPLELVKAGGEPQKLETVGVVLRGPGGAAARTVRNSVTPVERSGTQSIDIEHAVTRYPLADARSGCRAGHRLDQDRDPARTEADRRARR